MMIFPGSPMMTLPKSIEPDGPIHEVPWPDEKPPLLLHTCCGPCATHVIDLLGTDYLPICFFFNPNIHPEPEFLKRLGAAAHVCGMGRVALWVPSYEPEPWLHAVKGLEQEPEGGRRCRVCYNYRLKVTAFAASRASIPFFATTLTVSPHKMSKTINRIGSEISKDYDVCYLESDFKKKDGFKKSMDKSKKLGLYRQKSCGCSFSNR